jgi:hypothetical protein
MPSCEGGDVWVTAAPIIGLVVWAPEKELDPLSTQSSKINKIRSNNTFLAVL